jgi:hypothetical protein
MAARLRLSTTRDTKEKSMTRLCSLSLCAALGTGLLSCGSNGTTTKTALDLAPGENTVSGWTVDRAANQNYKPGDTNVPAPMTATSCLSCAKDPSHSIECLIDGAATPFCIASYEPKLFLWQNYLNKTLPAIQPDVANVSMYILEMSSVEQATGLYSEVLKLSEYDRKKGTSDDWKATSPVVGTESRIQDTGSTWWINFHQGVFYIEIVLTPSTGPAPDYTPGNADTKKEAIRFAQAVASKM